MTEHPLKTWRNSKGLSQMAAAKAMKVSLTTWKTWEESAGLPNEERMARLHKITGVTHQQLEKARE